MIRQLLTPRTVTSASFFSNNALYSLTNLKCISKKALNAHTNMFTTNTTLFRRAGISIQASHSKLPILQSSFKLQFGSHIRRRWSRTQWNFQQGARSYSFRGPINWKPLVGPAIFTTAFCVCNTLATPYLFNYTPLSVLKRSPEAFILGIIAANAAVFLAWKLPNRVVQNFLNKYFLLFKMRLSLNWALLGAAFSHQNLGHIFVNMFVLHSFGGSLCAAIGVANFSMMYLNSAVIASFISLALPVILRLNLAVGALGASGAIFSVFGVFSYLFPKAGIALLFIPIPGGAWVAFLGGALYNVAGLVLRWGAFDYAAHLGGCVAGLLYGWWFDKIRKERRRKVVYF